MGSADETVNLRLAKATVVSAQGPGATILPPERQRPAKRELPSISIDLRGTMPNAAGETNGAGADARDLEVLRTLGEGGMARVFLARQHSLDRDVAIKTVRDVATEVERRALLSEGAITGHLEHPSVIPVHALGVDHEGRPALVMKWVEGATWSDRIAEEPDKLDAHVETLMQVSNAVAFAHSRGIVHRDIKPENVLLGRYGEVYLADWGIALRLSEQAEVEPLCGTPSYMAPEMVTGGAVDERTDVYLLGAVLHRLLSGEPRHVATNVRATLVRALESVAVAYGPDVPAPLAALANDATSVDPAARPPTAAAFRQRLADFLSHKGSIALARSASERVDKLSALVEESSAHAQIDILAAEARFAIDESLRSWPENPEAQRADAALNALLEARRSRAAELERLARDLDPGVSQGQRVAALGVLVVVALGLAGAALVRPEREVTTRDIFVQSLGPVVVASAVIAAARRRLLGTALNRRAMGLLLVLVSSLAVHRGLALLAGTPAPPVLSGDSVIVGACCVVGALSTFRWLLVPAALMVATAAWAALAPADAMRAFSIGTSLALLACLALGLKPSAPR